MHVCLCLRYVILAGRRRRGGHISIGSGLSASARAKAETRPHGQRAVVWQGVTRSGHIVVSGIVTLLEARARMAALRQLTGVTQDVSTIAVLVVSYTVQVCHGVDSTTPRMRRTAPSRPTARCSAQREGTERRGACVVAEGRCHSCHNWRHRRFRRPWKQRASARPMQHTV